MSDETPKRPNEKYELTRKNNEENLVFYYNRERRLEKAPQSVKDMYAEPNKKGRFGLFSSLVADRPRAFLFCTIVVLCAVIIFLSVYENLDSVYTLEGAKLELSGTRYEGITIIVLRKTNKSADVYSGAVDIAVSVESSDIENFPVFYHRIFFSLEKEEDYRFSVPFDEDELLLVIQTENNSLKIRLKPD